MTNAKQIERPLVSVVVPCYNESAVFSMLSKALADLADCVEPVCRMEFVLVDDGSHDDTWDKMAAFSAADNRVRAVSLSRNFGHQIALTCGYDLAAGDAVVCMDADLQDPPEVVAEMIEQWQQGADIVYAVRKSRAGETPFKLMTARLFYRLFRGVSDSSAPQNAGDFRLLSRRALDAFNQLRERHRYIRGMVGWLGFKTATVYYERRARAAGETKYPLGKMVRFAADAIVSSSSLPLRLSYLFALVGSSVIFAYLLWVVFKLVFFDEPLVRGWSSLILTITLFGFLNLLCLGIIGEYIGRLYEQSKNRPLYLVAEDTKRSEK